MNYLIYIERSAENLQFYLWFRSYSKRFATLPRSDATLSPEWHEKSPVDMETRLSRKTPKPLGPVVSDALKEADFLQKPPVSPNPFNTPPPSTDGDNESIGSSTADMSSTQFSTGPVSTLYSKAAARELAAEAFDDADRLQPCKYLACQKREHLLTIQSQSNPSERRSTALSQSTSETTALAS